MRILIRIGLRRILFATGPHTHTWTLSCVPDFGLDAPSEFWLYCCLCKKTWDGYRTVVCLLVPPPASTSATDGKKQTVPVVGGAESDGDSVFAVGVPV